MISAQIDNIGTLETFFMIRFRLIPPLYARAIAYNVESMALRNCSLKDEFGTVKANTAHAFIGPSGLGIKSPPLKMAKEIITNCFPDYKVHGLSRFTVEGAIQYVGGRKVTLKEREDEGKEDLQPHLWGDISRDEVTRLFSDRRKSTMSDNWEFLSELLDGEIEPYTTRTYGFEGGLKDLHYSLLVCGSNLFLKDLDEDFWEQGLGNRIDWIAEAENTRIERIDGNKFFLEQSSIDEQLNEIQNRVKTHIERMQTVTNAHIFPDAREKWTEWLEELQNRAYKVAGMEGSFLSKYMLKSLKYAMLRASSNEDVSEQTLNIRLSHMEQAIADCDLYEREWRRLIGTWKERVRETKAEDIVRTSKYDLKEFLEITWRNGNGLCTVRDIQVWMHLTSKNQIADKLDLGVESGYLEVATIQQPIDEFSPNNPVRLLTDEEVKRFKPKTGAFPKVYRVTKKGYEWIGVEPAEVAKRE